LKAEPIAIESSMYKEKKEPRQKGSDQTESAKRGTDRQTPEEFGILFSFALANYNQRDARISEKSLIPRHL
jgi:hypothetical protein